MKFIFNKNPTILMGIFGFILFFTGMTITDKVTGFISRKDMGYYAPISWKEYFDNLPILLIDSLITGIFLAILYSQAKKNEEWRLNEAHKRIAEREKQEKEDKESESSKDVNKMKE